MRIFLLWLNTRLFTRSILETSAVAAQLILFLVNFFVNFLDSQNVGTVFNKYFRTSLVIHSIDEPVRMYVVGNLEVNNSEN